MREDGVDLCCRYCSPQVAKEREHEALCSPRFHLCELLMKEIEKINIKHQILSVGIKLC